MEHRVPLPKISDDELLEAQTKEPTAFRICYTASGGRVELGDVVLRKPTRMEVKRFKSAAKEGKDTNWIVDACLLLPSKKVWADVTSQELSGLPETVEDDLLKASGILAEQDLGKS
jgi:hypothetical protein